MLVLIDNYDSFTYNLVQALGSRRPDIVVIRNDQIDLPGLVALHPDGLVLSPGPGRPADAGITEDALRTLGGTLPILGVCLGHQAICEVSGGTVGYARELRHGKPSEITLDTGSALFRGLPPVITGARYHSLAALESTLPGTLAVTARTADGEVMAVERRDQPTYGVQFHPESIMTPLGQRLLDNFLEMLAPEPPAHGAHAETRAPTPVTTSTTQEHA
ncbi:MAG: aminodeoxychorismate/anthranilate synthase component II [Microbacteriaceae bacterium]|jgi:anthranilate synthase component 2|nr:aminodeoxychorismate/anthranilate synthase component II [Microbacteriaceae bacterium]MCI1207110.1 aminodeoxychorismate/anthranilate synthase component II [Microbacteriaceae bacterium]